MLDAQGVRRTEHIPDLTSMSRIETLWRSPDGDSNAAVLRAHHADVYTALAELDAFGHRLLKRATDASSGDGIDALVGLSMLRRGVTHFVGIRHLFEASAIEPGKLGIRAQFETLLAARYLVHGGRSRVSIEVPTSARQREARARYFYVAAERRKIYSRQALLDGLWGRQKISRQDRRAIASELSSERQRLDNKFPTQQLAFGPFLFRAPKGKRRHFDKQEWYSFGFRSRKVNSVRALARRYHWLWEYEMLYSAFSGLMHPRGITHDAAISSTGSFEIFSPYMAEAFELLSNWTCRWQFVMLGYLAKAYHPASLDDARAIDKKIQPILRALQTDIPAGLL